MPKRRTRRPFRKLVRDKIPEEIASEGRPFRKLEVIGSARDFLLRRKALEEIYELCNAQDLEGFKEELADVFEVLHALAAEHKIPLEDIESVRIAKRLARGGFDRGIFIDYIAPPETDSQIGLFGPLDYVSVTKRTPRANQIKIEEEQVLRIPLVPSHYQEEFRIGHYSVIYTDREILVRIAPVPDDKQFFLFGRDREFYDLSDKSLNLLDLLPTFEGFWKIYSNILLKACGFQIPESIIIPRLTSEAQKGLRDFCHRHKYTRFLVRHDRNPESATPPRGGYLVPLQEAERELAPFFAQGRILMLQEPLSPYSDSYSCNAGLCAGSSDANLEIVGPGFDASDLNRGDVSPHEVWKIRCDGSVDLNLASSKRIQLVDPEVYRQSVRKRLIKIGKRVTGAFSIDSKRKRKEKTEEQLIQLAKEYLKREPRALLLEHLDEYSPLSVEQIRLFAETLRELHTYREFKPFLRQNEIILSMSLLPNDRIACWQIVWPEKQQYGFQLRS